MKLRFQADADLNQIIVKAVLRINPAIDIKTAQAAKLSGLSDETVLAIAPVAKVTEDLILIWSASEAEEWIDRIHSLPL